MSSGQRVELAGYTDRPSVQPGQRLRLMASSSAGIAFQARLVRLATDDGGGARPDAELPVAASFDAAYEGAERALPIGSCMEALDPRRVDLRAGLTLSAWIWPTTPSGGRQCLLARVDAAGGRLALMLVDGLLALELDGRERVVCSAPVQARAWSFTAGWVDPQLGRRGVLVRESQGSATVTVEDVDGRVGAREPATYAVAAEPATDGPVPFAHHYNGKVESPAIHGRAVTEEELARLGDGADPTAVSGALAAWDYSIGIGTRRASDVSGAGIDGTFVQLPTRAVTGRRFSGAEVDWRNDRDAYAAVHFHDDDLDDAGWEQSFEWEAPEGLESGIYAVHLKRDDGLSDRVPFIVRPRSGGPGADIAFLAPTFTYLAYANEHQLARDELRRVFEGLGARFDYPAQEHDRYIVGHRLTSTYDRHRDGSGVCYSSWARPLMSVRPDYRFPYLRQGRGGRHGLPADLELLAWLERRGTRVDVLCDHDLHAGGGSLLARYRVVISGSHHEYWSTEMLVALEEYQQRGGRFVYLSGNGLYWVTGLDSEGNSIEVRRCGASTRTWEAAPGEWHLASTGELGGLWRFRGRAPQRLVGVGFTAEGLGPGRPYRRTPASRDPRVAFVFDGVAYDDPIGDFETSVIGYGAAGFEIDRFDLELGSPRHALVVASATGFSDEYQHAVDEVLHQDSRQGGTQCDLVRADMVFYETPAGGAVFSVGSIAWCGALLADGGRNPVARITGNVIDRFADPEPFELPANPGRN